MNEGLLRWKPQPATVISLVALFVALAGSAYAAKIGANKVKSKQIKDGQVFSVDVADLGIATVDLADGAVATAKLADNAVTTAKVADNAVNSAKVAADSLAANDLANNSVGTGEIADNVVTNPKVADNAIASAEVALDSLSSLDLNNNSVGSAEIQTGAVGDDEVQAGGLNADDVSSNTGVAAYDPPALAAGECDVHVVAVDADTSDDVVVITPDATVNALSAAGRVVYWAQNSSDNDKFRIVLCNTSNAAITNANIPVHNVRWMVFDAGVGG